MENCIKKFQEIPNYPLFLLHGSFSAPLHFGALKYMFFELTATSTIPTTTRSKTSLSTWVLLRGLPFTGRLGGLLRICEGH